MSVKIVCAQCAKSYRVDSKFAGKRVRCKNCGAAIRVEEEEEIFGIDEEPAAAMAPSVRESREAEGTHYGVKPGTETEARPGAGPRPVKRQKPAVVAEELDLPGLPDLSDLADLPSDGGAGQHFAMETAAGCPSCGQPLPAGNVVCLSCGFNRGSGRRAKTLVAAAARAPRNFAGGSVAWNLVKRWWWVGAYGAVLLLSLLAMLLGPGGMALAAILLFIPAVLLLIAAQAWWFWVVFPREPVMLFLCLVIPFVGLFVNLSNTISRWDQVSGWPLRLLKHGVVLLLVAWGLSTMAGHHVGASLPANADGWASVAPEAAPANGPGLDGPRIVPAAEVNPDFPARPTEATPEYGMFRITMATGGQSQERMELRLFLPGRRSGRIPCVFIAPAGTPCIWGNELSSGDRAECLPYVRAGFAVATYSLDGVVADSNHPERGMRAFAAAEGGVQNCRRAIDYVLAKVPVVDPEKLAVAGHSSAGTVALDVLAAESRIKAAAVYCPCVDVEGFVGEGLSGLERKLPGTRSFVRRISPMEIDPGSFHGPIFLLSASNDQVVSRSSLEAFAARVSRSGTRLERGEGVGSHYDGMIQGLSQGVAFLTRELHVAPAGMDRMRGR